MNKIIKNIMALCVTMCCTITLHTHCMLAQMLAGKQKFSRHPHALLRKKAAFSQPRFRLLFPQHRFYNAGAEVSNAQVLAAIEETNLKMDAILKEMRKQSLQTPLTTPVTTIANIEPDYSYRPKVVENVSDIPHPTKLEDYNILYGNR
jgi:hypothetical protein